MRARLLQFVTGSSRVPLQGFKALQVCRSGIRDLISIYFRHRDPLELLDLGFSLFTLWMLTPAISPKHTPASIGAISPSSRLISHRPLFRLDLPPYPSEEKMMDKLTQAVEETCGFAVEWISSTRRRISGARELISEYLTNMELLGLETCFPLKCLWSSHLECVGCLFSSDWWWQWIEISDSYVLSLLSFYDSLCSTPDRLLQLNFIPLGLCVLYSLLGKRNLTERSNQRSFRFLTSQCLHVCSLPSKTTTTNLEKARD